MYSTNCLDLESKALNFITSRVHALRETSWQAQCFFGRKRLYDGPYREGQSTNVHACVGYNRQCVEFG